MQTHSDGRHSAQVNIESQQMRARSAVPLSLNQQWTQDSI